MKIKIKNTITYNTLTYQFDGILEKGTLLQLTHISTWRESEVLRTKPPNEPVPPRPTEEMKREKRLRGRVCGVREAARTKIVRESRNRLVGSKCQCRSAPDISVIGSGSMGCCATLRRQQLQQQPKRPRLVLCDMRVEVVSVWLLACRDI